jgi:arabinofuranan 3-O-arabinosyltransferase
VLTLGVECVATFLSIVALVWMIKGTVKTLVLPMFVVLSELFFPMFHTLAEMNFTFVVLVLFIGTLWFVRADRWEIAGAVLGCSIAIKPLLGPVVLAFILAAKWRGVIWSMAVPIVLNILALPFIKDPGALIHNILGTYSQNTTNPTIISLSGIGSIYHVPDLLIRLAQLVVVLFGIGLLWLLTTRRRERTTFDAIVEASTVGILVECLVFTFAWDLYLILLIPLAVAALNARSLGRNPLFWIALALMAVNVVYGVPPGQELVYNRGQDLRMCLAMIVALLSLVPVRVLVPGWDGGRRAAAPPSRRWRPSSRAIAGPEG